MAFLVVLPIAGAIAVAYNKRIEEGIPVAMFIATFLAYSCGILDILAYSTILVGGLAIISCIFTVYFVSKKQSFKDMLTFGGVSYLILGIYYGLVCKGRMLAEQDDLMAYGKYVSDFYHVGKIYRYDYIPGMMMWEYLSEKFWRVFSESVLFWAVAMICVAMLLAIFSSREKKNIWHYIFVVLFIVLLPLMTLKRDVYFVLQSDFVMGVTVAYILCMYHKAREYGDRYYYVAVCLALGFLTITKSTGMFLAGITVLMLVGMDIIDGHKKMSLHRVKFSIACIASIIAIRLSWEIFVSAHDGQDKFEGSILLLLQMIMRHIYLIPVGIIVLAVALLILKRIAEKGMFREYCALLIVGGFFVFFAAYLIMPVDIRNEAVKNFSSVIFSTSAPNRNLGFGYRFYVPYALLIFFLVFVWELVKNANDKVNVLSKRMAISIHSGFALFASFVFMSGYFARSEGQAARAKEAERYLYAYIVVYLIVFMFLYLKYSDFRMSIYRIIAAFVVAVALLIGNVSGVWTQIFAEDNFYNFDGLNFVYIDQFSKFFLIDQRRESDYSRFNFRVSPGTMQNYYFSDMTVDGEWLGDDSEERYLTVEEWAGLLSQCTYVYIANTNEEFKDMYGSLFADEIIDGRIYGVGYNDQGEIELRLKALAD